MTTASKPPSLRRLIGIWLVGLAVGTLIIGVTSPWFVRSYLPLTVDPIRGVWTLPPENLYRWRSEGYADTFIGPHGMPGRSSLAPADDDVLTIALWGDSQAEGVCVADPEKLHAQIERQAARRCAVYPFARSGEDAAVWLTQMPAVERNLGVDAHLVLVVDLPDLLAAPDAPLPEVGPDALAQARRSIAARLPAFVIQAARYLLTEGDEQTLRTLRFSVGPAATVDPTASTVAESIAPESMWQRVMSSVRAVTEQPVIIVYAPHTPQIVGGEIRWEDPHLDELQLMGAAAADAGIRVIDMTASFRSAVREGDWPRGFHNGHIGSGHLNRFGYQLIAGQVADALMTERER